jgi:hypothetical protein
MNLQHSLVAEQLKSSKSPEEIALKHGVKVSDIRRQLKMGQKVEREHTKNREMARKIALQHLDELPDYYTKLKKVEFSEGNLHKWFKDSKSKDGTAGWVNVVTGGTCASDEPGEGTPKCVSSSKRASMTKSERLSAARRKKAADPHQQQKTGASKPTYVSTDKPKRKMKKEEFVLESDVKGKGSGKKDACYHKVKARYKVWPSAYASGALVKCRKAGASNWGESAETPQAKFDRLVSASSLLSPSSKIKMLKYASSKHPSKLVKFVDENHIDIAMGKMLDDEGSMVMSQLDQIEMAVAKLRNIVKDSNMQLPAWVQSKITMATDYIDTASDYMSSKNEEFQSESFKVIRSTGQLYTIMLAFMGKIYSIKIFFPSLDKPSLDQVDSAVQKIYPGGKTLSYYPCPMPSDSNYIIANEQMLPPIDPEAHRRAQKTQKLYNKGSQTDNPNEKEIFLKRTGPQLPLASRGKGGSPYEPYTPEKKGPYVPAPPRPKMQLAHYDLQSDIVESDDIENLELQTERKKRSKNYLINIGVIGESSPAWQRKEGKNPEGGLNKKGIESYRRENPGSKLSMAVTTPPSKLKPGSKAAKRRKSFCARMSGMPGPMKDEKGRPTRKALSLKKWNC